MRFGMFMAPFHPAGQNPTLALERDLDLIVDLGGECRQARLEALPGLAGADHDRECLHHDINGWRGAGFVSHVSSQWPRKAKL